MMRYLLVIILFFPLLSSADTTSRMQYIAKDSLGIWLGKDIWLFREGDGPAMAAKNYNDSGWTKARPYMQMGEGGKHEKFKGIGWFRLHFIADTSLVGLPLALEITQYGASEVFVDGKFVESFGTIKGKDSTVYYDPQKVPIVFQISEPGHHVIAIRYANYHTQAYYDKYDEDMGGFYIVLNKANDSIVGDHFSTLHFTFVMAALFGLFVAVALIHIIFFLYNRKLISHLYFSVFSLCLSGAFLLPFFQKASTTPVFQHNVGLIAPMVIALGCLSLSGFINEHFSKSKLRFKIIAAVSIVVGLVRLFDFETSMFATIGLMIAVAFEATILIIKAMVQRVPGVRILGAGILFFALFFLTFMAVALARQGIELNDSTTTGQIIELILLVSILGIPASISAYLAWDFARINRDLKAQVVRVQELSDRTLEQEHEKKRLLESQKEELEYEVAQRTSEVMQQKEEIERQHDELKKAKKQSDDLLLNILPEEVAEELKMKGTTDARYFDHVSVLFTDFVNFTQAAEQMTPKELVGELHYCFKAFDEIISGYGIEKIKTIGDAYLAVCGLPLTDKDHARKIVSAALDIREFVEKRKSETGQNAFEIRIGIHSGPVVAGIVGVKKFAFDIWGDTVNTAARMEQASEAGKINISQTTYELIQDHFECSYRGEIKAKHKGDMKMYFVEGSLVVG